MGRAMASPRTRSDWEVAHLVAHHGVVAADLDGRTGHRAVQKVAQLVDAHLQRHHVCGALGDDRDDAGAPVGGGQAGVRGVVRVVDLVHVRQRLKLRGHCLYGVAGLGGIDAAPRDDGDNAGGVPLPGPEQLHAASGLRRGHAAGVGQVVEHGDADGESEHKQGGPGRDDEAATAVRDPAEGGEHEVS